MTDIPKTMQAVHLVKFGPPKEALVFDKNTPVPILKKNTQVLIRVKAAGINPIDTKLASGNFTPGTIFMSLPTIPGADFSGIIVAKGAKVTEFEVGDHIFGTKPLVNGGDGVYAQFVVLDTKTSAIAKKPDHLSFEQAASTGIPIITAYEAIIKKPRINESNIKKKRNILIIGASGGVGSYGVQVAKAINQENTVIGICSEKNFEFVKSLGADRVVNYRDQDAYQSFINEKIPFDIIFDCVGGDNYYNALDPLLIKGGIYSTAVGPLEHVGSSHLGIGALLSLAKSVLYKRLFGPHTYAMITAVPSKDFQSKIATLFDDGKIKGTVNITDNIFPLKDIATAFEAITSQRTVGKIVLSID